MFDISFGELALIGTVALVVIGPEKLPKVARTAGMLFGRAQRIAANVRADLERELRTAEIADLKQKITDEAASFTTEMAEASTAVSQALAEPENHLLTQESVVESIPPLQQKTADSSPPKSARRRRKTSEVSTNVTPELATEAQTETAPVKKASRKRKAVKPEADLLAESLSTHWDERR